MVRYQGKHRQSTVTGRGVARVAMAGAVLAAPFAAALPANAASPSTWDALAQCESSGDWHIQSGNGFSGGLQFTESTWSAYGGDQYAANAADASREQQIAVAERVLQAQGPNAWPVCSQQVGLTAGGGLQNQDVSAGTTSQSDGSQQATQQSGTARQTDTGSGAAPADGRSYTVQPGDTLSAIGAKFGVSWQRIQQHNSEAISSPELIMPGQQLRIR
ncbi:LysM repeat protein [Saccharopolyspora lacisalsi]|uniref:LysM repeat protein n=1 Tax=Halosaccharopolyspora lacisalsi TaxID=1000566 RepID=A0A839DZ05_9PSEU|nr:transglycosylase family protein [Halosaccharopolyspora lacisalsi]MBA8824615.1 LysM repeat protein [Halosaccharopolyspora lacisalsi]